MKKKLFLLSILFLPTSIWLFLELSTINSKKLPLFGPKKLDGKDTVYYKTTSTFKTILASGSGLQDITLDTLDYPLFAVSFIKQSYKADNYRMAGLSEYIQFKNEKICCHRCHRHLRCHCITWKLVLYKLFHLFLDQFISP